MYYSVEAESIIKEYNTKNQSLDDFINNLEFKIIKKEGNHLEFDLKNCVPSFANALRRILISQIPTVAIEHVTIYENNTVFPDEYIAHRLGLIPIKNCLDQMYISDEENWRNVLNFKIDVTNSSDDIMLLTSDSIDFMPLSGQSDFYDLVSKNVLICKMAPGNVVKMSLKAILGKGEEHAKWSPVSLCSYKIMPKIILEEDFTNEDAIELKNCFSPGVIELINNKAVVINPRLESMSREVFRHDKFKDKVKILREGGWFCFTIESISEDPLVLVKKAINILIQSCGNLKEEIEKLSEDY